MGTRGLFGFRKDGVDKVMYNHYDSYPDFLGREMVDFCANHSIDVMNRIYQRIELVNEDSKPDQQQREICIRNGLCKGKKNDKETEDWYWLLHDLQGSPTTIKRMACDTTDAWCPMIDAHNFIKDSLFCEFAYIINLDTEKLEYWVGFQHKPSAGNRYGTEPDEDGYYPCACLDEIDLEKIASGDLTINEIVERWNNLEQAMYSAS